MSNFKTALFAQFAQVAKAMSSFNRLIIIEFLAQREHSVEDLANMMEISVANTSHHLQQLRHAGLVASRKEGQHVFYRLSGGDVVELMTSLRSVAERHSAEVDQLVNTYLTRKDNMEPISRDKLMERVKEGSVTVLDVRPPGEYAAGHLPGAINIPLAHLKKHLAEFDPGQEIIAYCRGPYCVLAFEAVNLLRRKGLKARRLEDGYPEWRQSGLSVEFAK